MAAKAELVRPSGVPGSYLGAAGDVRSAGPVGPVPKIASKSARVRCLTPSACDSIAEMASARMVDNARELAGRLAALKGGAGYQVRYALFPEETHLTGIPAATSRGVAFVVKP